MQGKCDATNWCFCTSQSGFWDHRHGINSFEVNINGMWDMNVSLEASYAVKDTMPERAIKEPNCHLGS